MADETDLSNLFQQWSNMFDELCQTRHEIGAAEYGQFTFVENDVVRMMAEELADTANYCRMQFIKLMMLQAALEDQLNKSDLIDNEGNITIGAKAFKGTGEGWGK